MNEITLLREAGPEPRPLSPAALHAARAALLAEIDTTTAAGGHQPRRPDRRLAVRTGIALAAAAAAVAVAVVVPSSEPPATPATSVALVAFASPTFPLTLVPTPAGLSVSYSADPGRILHALYASADDTDRIVLTVRPDEPDLPGARDEDNVEVQGREGTLATEDLRYGNAAGGVDVVPREVLTVKWPKDQWVELHGSGRFATRAQLVALAKTLVAEPAPVDLQVHLAPAGWSVQAYKDDTILTLANDTFEQQALTVSIPSQRIPADELRSQLMGPVGPVIEVSVNGLPAQLVRVDHGGGDGGWYLQARFAGGRTFVLQAPDILTQQQVLDIAAQVTYSP